MNSNGVILQFHHSFARGSFCLDVDLQLPGQGFTAIFGPSGCGKTTLLRLVAGLETCATGHLCVNGKLWQNHESTTPIHQRDLGFVFQEANLFPHLTVRANMEYGLRRKMHTRSPLRFFSKGTALQSPHLDATVDLLGISHLLERTPDRLSGGERQRVAIARALALQPQLLLMDEPLAALDQARKAEVMPYLQRLQSELRIPVLYVTHSIDEVTRLAQNLVVLRDGKCIASGPLQQMLVRSDLPFSTLEEASTVLEASITDLDAQNHLQGIQIGDQKLWMRASTGLTVAMTTATNIHPPPRTNSPVRIRIAARDVSLSRTRHEDTSILNHLRVGVTAILPAGHPAQALVQLDLHGQPLLARVTQRSLAHLSITPGQELWAQVKTMALV